MSGSRRNTQLTENLPAREANRLFEGAWQWFGQHRRRFEVISVLSALLKSRELTAERLAQVTEATLEWVELYGKYDPADDLLRGLLSRSDIMPEEIEKIDRVAMSWAEKHTGKDFVGGVLGMLLERRKLPPELMQTLVKTSVSWYDTHKDHDLAGYVAGGLLMNSEHLDRTRAQRIAQEAFARAEQSVGEAAAAMVLYSLLQRPDMVPMERVIELCSVWLQRHGQEPTASLVILPLLARDNLPPDFASRVGLAVRSWLAAHEKYAESYIVLHKVLINEDLNADIWLNGAHAALKWLQQYAHWFEAITVLPALTTSTKLEPREAARLEELVVRWLKRHGDRLEAINLLRGSLHGDRALSDIDSRITAAALAWIRIHVQRKEAAWLIYDFVRRFTLPDGTRKAIMPMVFFWLEAHIDDETGAAHLLHFTVVRNHINIHGLSQWIDLATKWLDRHSSTETAALILYALLFLPLLDASTSDFINIAVEDKACEWLRTYPDSDMAGIVAAMVLFRRDISENSTLLARTVATNWLEKNSTKIMSQEPLRALLYHDNHHEVRHPRVLEWAIDWVEQYGMRGEAHLLLQMLLANEALYDDTEQLSRVYSAITIWFSNHGCVPGSETLIVSIFGAADLQPLQFTADSDIVKLLIEHTRFNDAVFSRSCLALPTLLPLSARTGRCRLLRWTSALTAAALRDPRMHPSLRDEMMLACHRVLEAGAWPERTLGEYVLTKLGLMQAQQHREKKRRPRQAREQERRGTRSRTTRRG